MVSKDLSGNFEITLYSLSSQAPKSINLQRSEQKGKKADSCLGLLRGLLTTWWQTGHLCFIMKLRQYIYCLFLTLCFKLTCIFNTILGPGFGFKTCLGYRFAGRPANSIIAFFYTVKCIVDLFQQLPLTVHQSQCEFLFIIIRADIRHMYRHTR